MMGARMRFLKAAADQETAFPLQGADVGVWRERLARAERLVIRAAQRPYRAILALLALNLALIAVFVGLGELLFSDPAEFFRELMPGTWLSFVELLVVAVAAWAIYQRATGSSRLQIDNFWAISVVVFVVFAIDEATQATIFAADALAKFGALAPAGFKDLDAFLLVVLFLAAGAAMLRYGRELLAHPPALAVLFLGVLLGAASQTLDSLLPATQAEFVAEESLKLTAEAFLVGGYLVVLHRVLKSTPAPKLGAPSGA